MQPPPPAPPVRRAGQHESSSRHRLSLQSEVLSEIVQPLKRRARARRYVAALVRAAPHLRELGWDFAVHAPAPAAGGACGNASVRARPGRLSGAEEAGARGVSACGWGHVLTSAVVWTMAVLSHAVATMWRVFRRCKIPSCSCWSLLAGA